MKQIKAYDHNQIESKWQGIWDDEKLYEPNIKTAEKPFYNLFMFPYPSAEGMHAGHAMSSTGSDIFGRFQRMHGFDVLQPMGYDSFGIHSENYAIKIGETPQKMLTHAKSHFGEQFKSFGHGYAWSKELSTSDIDYYRWTQWLFVQMFKAGLAYKRHATVNFCPYDKTVLADEQVMSPHQAGKEPHLLDGTPVEDSEGLLVCERCGTVVEKKELSQWFFRITDYAERLLENLSKIDWSERVKIAQKEWIGKSEGREVRFTIYDSRIEIPVFTTKPETILGVAFIAISPEKAKDLLQYMPKVCKSAVEKYIKTSLNKSDQNRKLGQKDKTGVDTGLFALNPANKEKIRIWVADYVLADVGTGAVMGVPAGDERDHGFAVKHNIDVKQYKNFTKSIGERQVRYHLRDWLVSRQRYWGPPIPMIFCEHCAKQGKSWFSQNSKALHSDQSDWDSAGWYPEENLPVELPQIDDYKPRGNGKGPLANFPDFYKVKCPICGCEATRETDVSDTFVDSSWYFLRYPSIGYESASKCPFDPDLIKKWLPVDLYFGGAEHAVLHLMYARFVTMLLHDLGYLDFEEPFPKFFAHGLMIKDGAKMSKSRGNVVNPDEYIKKFGADTLRLYLVFIGPMDGYPDFRDNGIEGMHRFVKKLWRLMHQSTTQTDQSVTAKRHQTIKKVTNDISIFHYNTAIASIMEYINILEEKGMSREDLVVLTQLLAPFAPHVAEEIWREVLGNTDSVHKSTWPTYEEKYLQEQSIVIPVQINGKLRGQVNIDVQALANKAKVIEMAINNQKLSSWLKDKQIKNVIYVEGKILNLII